MITGFLLFADVSSVQDAMNDFSTCNPSLDVSEWGFEIVSHSASLVTVRAEPVNDKSFYVLSPMHFIRWA